jgi:hypothetical protein
MPFGNYGKILLAPVFISITLNSKAMKDARVINPSDIRLFYFGSKDVLSNNEEKEIRKNKLERAMILSNCEHISISLYLKLPNGDKLETESDLVDYADDFVILKGGYCIPVWAIFDVDV